MIRSAVAIASAMADSSAGEGRPSQFTSLRAAKIDAAISNTRLRPSSMPGTGRWNLTQRLRWVTSSSLSCSLFVRLLEKIRLFRRLHGRSSGAWKGREARWAVPKTAERISMGRVALGWLGEPTTRYGRLWLNRAVAELCLSTNIIPSKSTQIQAAYVEVNRRFLNNIEKIDGDHPRL